MQLLRAFLLLYCLLSYPSYAQQAHKVKLLCNWNDTTDIPLNGRGARYNEVWGFGWNGREYGVIGATNGAYVIDVSTCQQVAFAEGRATGAVHRDYKTYQHYLYAVSEDGMSTLQIFDFSYLPDSLHLVYESDPQDFSRAHKLFIDTNTAKLYCPSFSNTSTGHDFMRVYSLQRPDSPVLSSIYNKGGDVHDVYVRNDTAFCSSSSNGYYIVDFTHPPNSDVIGGLQTYPFRGFNHSSWIGSDGIGVMADETFGYPLKVIDTRQTDHIKVLSTFSPRGTDNTSIPHNPYMVGHFAFISYYMDGLQVYDLTDPANPVQAGYYLTYTGTPFQGYAGAWGCYPFLPSRRILISDMNTGLYVLDADEATGIQKDLSFSVYPNPATSQLFLRIPYEAGGHFQYAVFDLLGRCLYRQQMVLNDRGNPPVTLPLPGNWPAGIYMIRANAGGQPFTARFIKL